MASPLKTGKSTVALPAGAARPSRIRRDPPPPEAKPKELAPPGERETWTVVIGVLMFGIAITIIILGISDYLGS